LKTTDNIHWTASFTPAADVLGKGAVSLPANNYSDVAGNNGSVDASAGCNIDTLHQAVFYLTQQPASGDLTEGDSITYTLGVHGNLSTYPDGQIVCVDLQMGGVNGLNSVNMATDFQGNALDIISQAAAAANVSLTMLGNGVRFGFMNNSAQSFNFTWKTIDDTIYEPKEGYSLQIVNVVANNNLNVIYDPSNYYTQVIITDNDTASTLPYVAIASSATIDEGAGVLNFAVTLVGSDGKPYTLPNGMIVAISYHTGDKDDTAVAGEDYTSVSDKLTLDGTNIGFIKVPITDDMKAEGNESFQIVLDGAVAVVNGVQQPLSYYNYTSSSIITIYDNDTTSMPTLSIVPNVSATEGDSGSSYAYFRVSLSAPITSKVTVDYTTKDITANAVSDYIPTSGTLTFDPNSPLSQEIKVEILPDTLKEDNETFYVSLSNLTGAGVKFSNTASVGTIVDNDSGVPSLPVITLSDDVTVVEGNPGEAHSAVFSINISQPLTTVGATVDYGIVAIRNNFN
jgi:hypothetical protein